MAWQSERVDPCELDVRGNTVASIYRKWLSTDNLQKVWLEYNMVSSYGISSYHSRIKFVSISLTPSGSWTYIIVSCWKSIRNKHVHPGLMFSSQLSRTWNNPYVLLDSLIRDSMKEVWNLDVILDAWRKFATVPVWSDTLESQYVGSAPPRVQQPPYIIQPSICFCINK